jgi:hypothetical protein
VLVVNKIDIFEREADLQQVLDFVRQAAQQQLNMEPETFGVSARLALKAKQGQPAVWQASGFEPLERFIHSTLEEESRFRLKLDNPLGVAQALAYRYATIADERLLVLKDDIALLDSIEAERAVHRDDMARGFELRMTGIEKVLVEMEARGHVYFEDTLRVGRMFDLLNRSRVQKEFEDRVVGDAPRTIERRVAELIDWLVDQDFRQWQAVTSRLAERGRDQGSTIGAPAIGSFHSTRAQLREVIGHEAQRVVETYDRQHEAASIAEQARAAVTTAAATGGAAVGLGTLVTVAASTAAADVTGILMASLIAMLGFLVIPARRRRAKAEMKEKMTALRERLALALRTEFQAAQTRAIERLQHAVDPYQRFVLGERTRWQDAAKNLRALSNRAAAFRDQLAA